MEMILTLMIPVTFLLALGLERAFPARRLPKVSWWVLKGFLFFVIVGAINAIIPALVGGAMSKLSGGLHLDTKLGILPQALLVLITGEVIAYWVHRGLHRNQFAWRWTHQMHHSAERFDVAGAVYFHPLDIAVQVGLASIPVALLGVSADAGALAGFTSFAVAIFQHLNVRTPRWLGYIVGRPEQHSLHHERGVHAYNYGNFAFMDLIFGTFRNPKDFSAEQGFWDGASKHVGAMLIGRDVGERPRPRQPQQPQPQQQPVLQNAT